MTINYKNLGLNDSERDWLLKVRSIIKDPLPKIPTPPNDEIWYTSSDGNIVVPANITFGADIDIVSNTYENGKGIIKFDGDVTSIGNQAFENCTGLTSITSLSTTPPTLGDDSVFLDTNNSPIYVPSESVRTYQSSWSTYADRILAIQ